MKKIVFSLVAASMLFVGCQKSNSQNPFGAGNDSLSSAGTLIGYVEMDSIANNYQYCKDQVDILNQKQAGYDQKLQGEGRAVQQAYQKVQQNAQNGVYTTEQQYNNAMQSVQAKQNAFEQLQAQYQNELMQSTDEYVKEFYKRLRDFLSEYNKDGRFALILTNSDNNINVLLANPALNITNDVIEGLNKGYKANNTKKDEAKTEDAATTNAAAPADTKK